MCKGRFNVILVFLIVSGRRYNVNPQFFSASVRYTVHTCMYARQVRFLQKLPVFLYSYVLYNAHCACP